MAEKLALPLLLPNLPASKSFSADQHHTLPRTPFFTPPLPPPSPPPVAPVLRDLFIHRNPNSLLPVNAQTPRTRTRIGRHRDPNRGKPWSDSGLSTQGREVFGSIIDPRFDSSRLDSLLSQLFEPYKDNPVGKADSLAAELQGLVKGLGFHKKCDLALLVLDWFKNQEDYQSMLDNTVVSVIISMLGKEGRVSSAVNLLNDLQKDGFAIDVYSYFTYISIC